MLEFISTCHEWDPSGRDVDSVVEVNEENQLKPSTEHMVSFFLLGRT